MNTVVNAAENEAPTERKGEKLIAVAKASELLRCLQGTTEVAARKGNLPILSNVLLERTGGQLRATANDLEHQLQLMGAVGDVPGQASTTVSARKLNDLLRAVAPDAAVRLAVKGAKMVVQTGRSIFRLNTLPSEEFPRLSEPEYGKPIVMQQKVLRRMLAGVSYCMSTDASRYYMCGVRVEAAEGRLAAVATDGHRLASATEPVENAENGAITMPRNVVNGLLRLLNDSEDEVSLRIGEGRVAIEFGAVRMVSKTIDGAFPDWKRVVPGKLPATATFDRDKMLGALGRAKLVSTDKFKAVTLTFRDGAVELKAGSEDETANEEVPVAFTGDGEMVISFNVNYLTEAIAAMGEGDVQVGLNDSTSSILIREGKGGEYKGVLMPMRV